MPSLYLHFIMFLLILGCGQWSRAAEPAPQPPLRVDPAVLIASQSQASVSGQLTLAPPADAAQRVRVRAMPAERAGDVAPIGFPANERKDWIELELPAGKPAGVQFEVTPPAEGGLYRGILEAFRQDDNALIGTAEVLVKRLDPNFAIAFSGAAVKEGRLEFPVADSSSAVGLTVRNTNERSSRVITLTTQAEASPTSPQPALSFTPNSVRLGPQQEAQVVVRMSPDEAGGSLRAASSYAVIRAADAAQPGLYRDIVVHVSRTHSVRYLVATTFGLVLLGAFLSVLIRTVFPTGLAKRRNRNALSAAEAVIRRCTNASALVKSALLAESSSIRLLNTTIHWYSGDRANQIETVGRLITTLNQKRDVAVRIAALRDTMANQLDLPFRAVIAVEQLLHEAEDLLILNRPDAAGGKIDEADAARQNALTEANIDQIRTLLTGVAERLEKELPGSAAAGWPSVITEHAQRIVATKGRLQERTTEDVVRIEHAAAIVLGFLDDFLPARTRTPECADLQDLFLNLLQTDRGPVTVRPLAIVLKAGLTPDRIAAEIENKRLTIMVEPDPPPFFTLMQFWLRFHDPQLEGISAARRLIEYEWSFGDDTQIVRAERGQHYYLPSRNWLRLNRRVQPPFRIRCALAVPYSARQGTPMIVERELKPRFPEGSRRPSLIEVFDFLITAVIAVLAAYAAQYATVASLDSFGAWLTPFLFGFGLDQLRERATR